MPELLPKQSDFIEAVSAIRRPKHIHAAHSVLATGKYIVVGKRPSNRCVVMGERRFYVMQDDIRFALEIDDAPVRRDPIVAALFGECRLVHCKREES